MLFENRFVAKFWWSQGESNSRPPACKADALPSELWPLGRLKSDDRGLKMVTYGLSSFFCLLYSDFCPLGLGGFEPPTSPLSGVRSKPTELQARKCFFSLDQAIYLSTSPYALRQVLLKEVIQPQVPLRLPCYDFTPVMNHKVVSALPCGLDYLLLLQPTPMV